MLRHHSDLKDCLRLCRDLVKKMLKCYAVLLLLCALLASSKSAPTLDDQTNPIDPLLDENGNSTVKLSTIPPSTTVGEPVKPKLTTSADIVDAGKALPSKPVSSSIIHSFAKVFADIPVSELKILADALENNMKASEFEGLLGALIINNPNSDEVLSKVHEMKDNLNVLHGILNGLIAMKEYSMSKSTPKPAIIISNQDNQPPPVPPQIIPLKNQLNKDVELVIDKMFLSVVKTIPIEDLQRLLLLDGNNLKMTLKSLQHLSPILTDSLINVAVQNPSDLKAAIQECISESSPKATIASPTENTVNTSKEVPTENQNSTETPKVEDVKDLPPIILPEVTNEQSNDDVLTKSKGGADGGEEYEEFLFPNGLPDPNNNDHESPPDPNLDPKLKPQDLDTKQEDTKLQDNLLIKPVDESGGWFGAWHFLIIFLIIAALVGVGYVFTHNRKKIREGIGAYVSDAASRGRRTRNYRYKPVSST